MTDTPKEETPRPEPWPCTLKEFIEALDAAYYDLFITWDERNAAIEKFKLEVTR